MFIITVIEIYVGLSIYFVVKFADLYVFDILLIAICMGGTSTIIVPTFNKIYDIIIGPELFGLTGISIGFSNILGPLFFRLFSDEKYSFMIFFFIGTGFCVIQFIVLIFFDENKKYYDTKKNDIQMNNIFPINDNDTNDTKNQNENDKI